MQPHLTDEALNEYLDEALPPDQHADAAAHLAHCQPCTTRLDALRVLFTDLAALPEVPLTRDLAPAVLKALPAQAPALAPTRVRRQAGPWLLAGEAVAAALVLIIAWPLITTALAAYQPPADFAASVTRWLTGLPTISPTAWLADAQRWVFSLLPTPSLTFDLSRSVTPLLIGVAVAAAAALWLVGNALLLGRPLTTLLQETRMNNLAGGLVLFVGGALVLASFYVVLAALFPERLARTRRVAGRAPLRAFVIGLINAVFVSVLAAAGLAVASWTGLQFLGLVPLLLLAVLAVGLTLGLAGVVLLLGERLLPERGPVTRTAVAAVVLGLACSLPYVGWFGLFPYVGLLGLGAFILSFFERDTPPAD